MVFYYTFTQKTKIFAEILGELKKLDVYGLECDLNKKSNIAFTFGALMSCITKKSIAVNNMPPTVSNEIYVCSPVWGGELAAPVKYFLENMDLKGTKVNILLTAGVPVEKYKNNALEFLQKVPCEVGNAYIFATDNKTHHDREVIKEHLGEML